MPSSSSLMRFAVVTTCILGLASFIPSAAASSPVSLTARVVIVRNSNSPISKAIASDYMTRRGVQNVVDVNCPDGAVNTDNESISFQDFQSKILAPLRSFLSAHPGIDFIVLTKGVPLRLNGAQPLPSSLDSYLAGLDYDKIPGAVRILVNDPGYRAPDGGDFHGFSWSNRFWNSKKHFTHAEFGGYLVTRLDGYTQSDAVGLTTKSLNAEKNMLAGKIPTGQILLDQDPSYGVSDPNQQPYSILKADVPVRDTALIPRESDYGDYNADMALAADTLKARKIPCMLETTDTFKGLISGLMGYISWGSNDRHYDAGAYLSLGFADGGIAETAVSTSARTFLPTSGGQSLLVDIIKGGATGMKGYSDEPFLQACASPSILYRRYTSGWTLAEAYYAASNEVGWEDIVVGDPLCRAYPGDSSYTTAIAGRADGDGEAPGLQGPLTTSLRGNDLAFVLASMAGASRMRVELFTTVGNKVADFSGRTETGSAPTAVWTGGAFKAGAEYGYRVTLEIRHAEVTLAGKLRILP